MVLQQYVRMSALRSRGFWGIKTIKINVPVRCMREELTGLLLIVSVGRQCREIIIS